MSATSATYAGTLERPERGYLYFHILSELKLHDAPDTQRQSVYRWQAAALAELSAEGWLGADARGVVSKREARVAAVTYVEHLWKTYAPRFNPYFTGVPSVRLGFSSQRPRAYAHVMNHAIYCTLSMLHRKTMVHEVCHLLAWCDFHGPAFCAALVELWAGEFGIERGRALDLAAEHGVQIA